VPFHDGGHQLASTGVGRPLTPSEAAAALRRGRDIEQFISINEGQVTYLVACSWSDRFRVTRHVVHDEGTDEYCDISEFSPVDADEDVGEGAVVAEFDEPHGAVSAAEGYGGASSAWVNFGMAANDYRLAKTHGV
jgi:hypothetical protein